ncbi:hypothetical protein HMPREF0080_00584 [Anaeroglobus geminatus F0357]|uniref:Uncharacterized protein n=1 Tax=Anaeroglobus geminatus F0357 TaxID=861450 RepID=G9YG20_9FIRM|nr:hypothetical protein HMPREF0080_00584 [Anaeroglobus geminatus F0357]
MFHCLYMAVFEPLLNDKDNFCEVVAKLCKLFLPHSINTWF